MTIRRKLRFVVGSYLVILTILFLMVFHGQSAGMLIVSLLVLLSLGGPARRPVRAASWTSK